MGDQLTSRQKIAARFSQLDEIDPSTLDTHHLGLLLAITTLRGKVLDALPEDPDELDHLLLIAAAWALELRSDHAPAFTLMVAEPAIVAADNGGQPAVGSTAQPTPAELQPAAQPTPADAQPTPAEPEPTSADAQPGSQPTQPTP